MRKDTSLPVQNHDFRSPLLRFAVGSGADDNAPWAHHSAALNADIDVFFVMRFAAAFTVVAFSLGGESPEASEW